MMKQSNGEFRLNAGDWLARAVPFGAALAAALVPELTGAWALLFGLLVSLLLGWTLPSQLKPWNPRLLGVSIVLMGAATPVEQVLRHGTRGLGYSAVLIALVLLTGIWLSKKIGMEAQTGVLISSGTAICGGSAIAATGPAIGATSEQTGIAVAVVFLLNAISVFLFPPLGHWLGLDPEEFGRFAALAIHDTSSVLAASVAYGGGAEQAAVPMKLARALWIVPMAALLGVWWARRGEGVKSKGARIPWFVPAFVVAAAAFSWIPGLAPFSQGVGAVGRRLLVAALFWIGNAITLEALKKAGLKPLVLGLGLWVLVIVASGVLLRLGSI